MKRFLLPWVVVATLVMGHAFYADVLPEVIIPAKTEVTLTTKK